ncbi:glucose sorbosone dehydrogenase, partial [Spirosoma agri]|nr:glucose sorbosone dehydrogenase [Spirosoma agri]
SSTGVSTVVVTATDGGGLSASTGFTVTVTAPVSATIGEPGSFTITGVQTVSCVVVSGGQRAVTFTPQYGGMTGGPINFSVVNERAATSDPGPYTLTLYTDNPTITLSAQQGSTAATYRY